MSITIFEKQVAISPIKISKNDLQQFFFDVNSVIQTANKGNKTTHFENFDISLKGEDVKHP